MNLSIEENLVLLKFKDFSIFTLSFNEELIKKILINFDKKSKIFSGRGDVYVYDKFVLRQYKHGGLFRKILNNKFFSKKRFISEFLIHNKIFNFGISTSRPIGIIYNKKILYEGWYISELLQDTIDFVRLMLTENSLEVEENFRKAGELIKVLHENNFIHGDLHVKNFLINLKKEKIFLIDFDKSIESQSNQKKEKDIKRFFRSIYKFVYFNKTLNPEILIEKFSTGYGKKIKYKPSCFNKISWKLNKPFYLQDN